MIRLECFFRLRELHTNVAGECIAPIFALNFLLAYH